MWATSGYGNSPFHKELQPQSHCRERAKQRSIKQGHIKWRKCFNFHGTNRRVKSREDISLVILQYCAIYAISVVTVIICDDCIICVYCDFSRFLAIFQEKMKFFGETFAQFKKTFYLCIAFQGKHLTREAGRSKRLPIPTAKAFGRLAQLVQSVCLTSRGSAVRIRQRPPK